MNRITQLTVESDLIEWDILPSGVRTPNHESVVKARKFAELIVRECMALCKTSVGNADYNTGRLHCLENIKEHFGVEE